MNPEVPNPNRVLVIDDSESIHKLVVARLRPEGLEVLGEVDGERGIERAIADQPDLILLDIGLPNVDGFEVCRRLRSGGHEKAVIVAITGYGQDEDRRRSRTAGFDAHMVKPVNPDELVKLVESAARSRQGAPR